MNRQKAADRYRNERFGDPWDLVNHVDRQIEMAEDPQVRQGLQARRDRFVAQARAANAAKHSMRPTQHGGPGSPDITEFDGTWDSVNTQLRIKDVQEREHPAEISTLELLGFVFRTDRNGTSLRQVFEGLGLSVHDELFSVSHNVNTVAFWSKDDVEGLQYLCDQGRLPRCILSVCRYRYKPEKWHRQPRFREEAVCFKNMWEHQQVTEEYLREVLAREFAVEVRDVYVKEWWSSSQSAYFGFVEFEPGSDAARQLLDRCFEYDFRGKTHTVLQGPSHYIAFKAWA